MSEDRQTGIGRAGRGAMLLQALKNQPRRPGESRPTGVEQEPCVERAATSQEVIPTPRAVGRAALLQNILKSSGRGSSSISSTPDPEVSGRGRTSTVPIGRGNVSSLLGRGRAAPITKSPDPDPKRPSPELSGTSGYDSEPLEKSMEEVHIGQHSGKSGTRMDFEANYIRLKSIDGRGIYEYHVSFQPAVDSRNMKFKLMNQDQVKAVTGGIKSFDGSKLYLPRMLQQEQKVQTCLPTDNSEVVITIKYIKKCTGDDIIHLYNLLFRRIMAVLKMVQVGRNYFDPKGGIPVPKHRLEIWPGYVTAVQEFEGGVMLCCDASFRVLRTITAREVMNELSSRRNNRGRQDIEDLLIGTIVLTRYNNKTYRVDDISWEMTPRSTFSTRDGKQISFQEYYSRSYDIHIKDLDQPLLINKPDKKINADSDRILCLVPELCYMTGLTDDMRSDFRVMKDVSSHTKMSPANRQLCLKKFIDNIKSCPDAKKVLQDWNLEFDESTIHLEGRGLEPERIIMKNAKFSSPNSEWGRDVGKNEVLVPVDLQNWIIVYTRRDEKVVGEFVNMMKKVCSSLGININFPMHCSINDDRTDSYLSALKERVNPRVQAVVIVFPSPRDDRYSAVKKLCCVEMPVPSQVINVRTISDFKKLRSVTIKIAMQINCKLGGELWTLPVPLNNIMVCGMDAYHDKSRRNNSVLGFVASLNHNLTRYYSITATQKPGQELGDTLRMLFLASLRKFHQVNHQLPQKIFIFRDGVSDGMIDVVAKYEFEQFKACFPNMNPSYNPALSVIVVQKRINTRIFRRLNGNIENPPPGSILDHSVTRKKYYDFFLVPQHVTQGTVTPTHFIVAREVNSTLQPDQIQRLTYKTTHLYFNWPGTIRVPAPCMYAHKLAFLVGQNLHKDAHVDLADKLFYL